MDVKNVEIQVTKLDDSSGPKRPNSDARSISSLSARAVTSDAVKVEIPKQSAGQNNQRARLEMNRAIAASNVAKQGSEQIDQIFGSINGIVEQAEKASISPERRAVLEREANDLLKEVKKVAETSTPDGVRPLAGDKIRLEVEQKLGKTLDRLLPDQAKDSFGLTHLDFSTKEAIIDTRTRVKRAEEQLINLRKAVDDTTKEVKHTAELLDVAIQNTEASQASVRDVDQAIKLANETRDNIKSNPERALQSIGDLGARAADPLTEN